MGELDDEIEKKKKLLELLIKGYSNLSKRELDVMVLIATGHTDKQIGELLFISEHTAGTHHQNIYKKLGVHTKSELYKLVKAMGLV